MSTSNRSSECNEMLSPDAVVISGMAGRFPDSDDIYEFRDNLFNKIDLVNDDERRWAPIHAEVPQRTGKINLVQKFDAGFFGVHQRQGHIMDPMCRMLFEHTFEAILDAGINPKELHGTNTGVFIGACFSEAEKTSLYEDQEAERFAVAGCVRSMLAKRLSYWFQLQGKSFITDTACSSSMFALEHAHRAIKEGACNMAIVGGCNLCLLPMVSLQFARLGVLSLDGACKSFDEAANGYARSEAVSVVILQKAKEARRVYAEVIHSKTNCDGFKEQGITYPSGKVQKVLLEDFYQECGVDPAGLTYVEAHGTGTKVGDPEELGTLDEIFCKNRERPLLIGSVKSNIGHNEPASGLCSVVKVVLAFETGYIPPNIHYNIPRQGVEALATGRLKVVSERSRLPDDKGLIGINSFGFGGANSHLLVRWNQKAKQQCGDALPRLVCLSGRTPEALAYLMDSIRGHFDHELIALLQKAYQHTIPGHFIRGFLVLTRQGTLMRSSCRNDVGTTSLALIFGRLEGHLKFGRHLFNIPVFAAHVKRVQNLLISKNLLDPSIHNQQDNRLGAFILHSGVYQILKELRVTPDLMIGIDRPGKLAALWANNILSLEEVLAILFRERSKSGLEIETLKSEKQPSAVQLVIGTLGKPCIESKKDVFLLDAKSDSIVCFFQGLGQLYQHGYDLTLENIYPRFHWPVGRGTPMISPLIKWDHRKDWFVMTHNSTDKTVSGQRVIRLSLRDDEWGFLKGHIIDGRCLFPATAYLMLIWDTLARLIGKLTSDMKVIFEDVKFLRACTVTSRYSLELILIIRKGTGYFEVVEGGSQVVTGRIYEDLDMAAEWRALDTRPQPVSELRYLNEKNIYKELRLRGYNYKGDFRALKACNLSITMGTISWTGNWIPLMDAMLQMQILSEDTRNLYVPTGISKVMIDSAKHTAATKSFSVKSEDPPSVPVYFYKDMNILRCGGVEMRGLKATAIGKRRQADPVLEIYKFIPYFTSRKQSVGNVMRQFVQIALENEPVVHLKSVELLGETPLNGDMLCLSQHVKIALEDQPVVKAQLTVLSARAIDPGHGIIVEDKKITTELDCYLVIVQNLTKDVSLAADLLIAVKRKGFIISMEELSIINEDIEANLKGFDVISLHLTEHYKMVLLKPTLNRNNSKDEAIEFANMTWFDPLQACLKNEDPIILWSTDPHSGILGFSNCLRRELSVAERLTTVWMPTSTAEFSWQDPFFRKQLSKNLAVNVLRGSDWGSYRHFKLPISSAQVDVEHCYVNVTNYGDLSSLKWIEGPLKHNSVLQSEQILVRVYYSAINFKDVMIATGRIHADVITRKRSEQDYIQGIEYAGRTMEGVRVMGMSMLNAIATLVPADVNLLWKVPDEWSIRDAATVPAVYSTVLYGLIKRAGLRRGESILIHSGTGGVGHAAIHVAMHFGCQIFVTVGTEAKKRYVRDTFPYIEQNHIGNSRDSSFLQMIMKYTSYEGVDLVLNSLADEKLQASVKCLKIGGRFVEIGKYDLAADSQLSMDLVDKQAVYYGVMLDSLFVEDPVVKQSLCDLVQEGINLKYVKPLPLTCFKMEDLEEAYRYMVTGKHMGKVLIEVRTEEGANAVEIPPRVETFKAQSRFYCNPDKAYLVNGGLGGFGLELIDWLVLRGARHIMINSRRGISSAYQKLRLKTWRSYGTTIKVFTEDLSSFERCKVLLASSTMSIAAIFNLAVLLKDSFFENQTEENFQTVLDPKATATQNLDTLSRIMCPDLEYFVVFSSVSCGRGNAGQTNYGLANSVMERICEERVLDGLPGLAIQWGAIGDVGLVADRQEENTELVIGGTLQQKITSCLDTLDRFLQIRGEPIVGSMVVAEKKAGADGANNIVEAVVNILGLRDLKTVSQHSSFPELGMDSMMALEIKQTLEREYDVFLSPQDIRGMSFSRLQEIAKQKTSDQPAPTEVLHKGVKMLMRFIANESEADIPFVRLVQNLPAYDTEARFENVKLLLFPGIEGMAQLFDPMREHLTVPTISMQYCYSSQEDTIYDMARKQVESMQSLVISEFCIAAHSFGSAVALEVVAQLEKLGLRGTLVLLDGAPSLMKRLIRNQFVATTEAEFQTSLLCSLMSAYLPFSVIATHRNQMLQCDNYEQRIDIAVAAAPKQLSHRPEYLKKVCQTMYKRMKAINSYEPSFGSLESKVLLFRPTNSSVLDIEEDYDLPQVVGSDVDVRFYAGNHVSILENLELIRDLEHIAQNCGTLVKGKESDESIQKPVTIPKNLRKQTIS